jgi:hypothetical protein
MVTFLRGLLGGVPKGECELARFELGNAKGAATTRGRRSGRAVRGSDAHDRLVAALMPIQDMVAARGGGMDAGCSVVQRSAAVVCLGKSVWLVGRLVGWQLYCTCNGHATGK